MTFEAFEESRRWHVDAGGRIVVGREVDGETDLEAEPVASGATFVSSAQQYRPDSAVDGWRAGPFSVRAASVRGDAHRYHGVPRQDDMCLAWDAERESLVIAVADGVSGAPLSHIGASTVCRYATDLLLRGPQPTDPDAWNELLRACAWALVDVGQRLESLEEPDPERTEEWLATTLCVATLSREGEGATLRAASVGDSGLAVVREGEIVPLLGGKAPPIDGIVDHGVVPLPRLPQPPPTGEWQLCPGETLLVGTDGIWDPVGDGSGTVAHYLLEVLGSSFPGRADFLLLVDFYRETHDDDRTLVAVRLDGTQPSA
ncbi:MAG: protein phosphatase 2C domain-containing protein [Acidimicrobiaceae bacterium]|nr:protein phosphatase 2C domain-containing protein [Acidimicrobiaceae bacterium]